MKTAIIGAGAMGCFIGAMLSKAGNDVTMIDVDKRVIDAINERGIHLELRGESMHIPVKASLAKDMTEKAELAILFTKAAYSRAALEESSPYIGEDTYVLTMQNGLGNVELLCEYFAEDRVIAAVTTYAGDVKGPAHTATNAKGYLKMMTANGEMTETLVSIDKMLREAGLESEICPDVMAVIWEKVAFNAAINATSALCRVPCGGMAVTEEGRSLVYKVAEETCRVAAAHGIYVDAEAVKGYLDIALTVQAGHFTSMTQDLQNKRLTEAAFINGAIWKKAQEAGLEASYNETMYALLHTVESTYDMQK